MEMLVSFGGDKYELCLVIKFFMFAVAQALTCLVNAVYCYI